MPWSTSSTIPWWCCAWCSARRTDCLAKCGRYREARRLLWQSGLGRLAGRDRVSSLKLRWVEARVDAGLGHLERAEAALSMVRDELGRAGLPYKRALASLDLAMVRLRLGKVEEVEPLVEEMVAVFQAQGIRREVVSALRLLA